MRRDRYVQPELPFARSRDTSVEAAESMELAAPGLRGRVLEAIRQAGGATDEEVVDATGLAGNTVRPRRGELEAMGLVRDSGLRRATRSGRSAIVWGVVQRFPKGGCAA